MSCELFLNSLMFDASVWLVGISGTFRFAISGADHQGLVNGAVVKLTRLQRGHSVGPCLRSGSLGIHVRLVCPVSLISWRLDVIQPKLVARR